MDFTPFAVSEKARCPPSSAPVLWRPMLVIDIDCWDSGRSVASVWSSRRGRLENPPLAFTRNIPLSSVPSFTLFSCYSSPHSLAQLSRATETIHKSRLHEPGLNFYIRSVTKGKRRGSENWIYFPFLPFSVTHTHTHIFWFALQGGDLDSASGRKKKGGFRATESGLEFLLTQIFAAQSGAFPDKRWQMTGECQRCFATFPYQSR